MNQSRQSVLERFVRKQAAERRGRPVVVGVIGDFTGRAPQGPSRPRLSEVRARLRDRRFITLTPANFDNVLGHAWPSVRFDVPACDSGAEPISIELAFERLSDFDPAAVARRVPAVVSELSELSALRARGRSADAAALACRIGNQLDAVLHAPPFQALEAAWRGLHLLVTGLGRSERFLVRILDVSKRDLATDFEAAAEFDQAFLFKHAHDHALGMFGGRPFDLLIANYFLTDSPPDLELLEKIAATAAAIAAPVLIAVIPSFFGVTDFAGLANIQNLARVLFARRVKLRSIVETAEDFRWVGLLTPRVLLRPPHRVQEPDGLAYREAWQHTERPWGHPGFVVGLELARSFATHRFRRYIPGLSTGSLVRVDQPLATAWSDSPPLEFGFSQHSRYQLAATGVTALWTPPGTGRIAYRTPSGLGLGGQQSGSTGAANAGWPVSHLMIAGRLYRDTRMLFRAARGLVRVSDEDASELTELVGLWSTALADRDGGSIDVNFDELSGRRRSRRAAANVRFVPMGGEREPRRPIALRLLFDL